MRSTGCRSFFAAAPMGRREFLHGSASLVGLGLPQLLQARGSATRPSRGHGAPGLGKAKACIILFMWGGPAQQDTWDPKPDAPVEYRGEFKTIPTTLPGIRDLRTSAAPGPAHGQAGPAPGHDAHRRQSRHQHALPAHGPGLAAQGAALAEDWPSYGAVLRSPGPGRGPLPPFVSMMPRVPNGTPRFVEESHGQGAGWLGPVYEPMRIDDDASKPDYQVADFALQADVPRRTQRAPPGPAALPGRAAPRPGPAARSQGGQHPLSAGLCAAVLAGGHEAFDLSREDPRMRERYGMNIHGQAVLQARRLVEAGVPLVTVFWQNDGMTNVSVYWDTHNRNFIDLRKRLCPVTDQAFSAPAGRPGTARHAGRDAGGVDGRDGADAAGRPRAWWAAPVQAAMAATTGRPCSPRSWPAAASRAASSTAPAIAMPPTPPATRQPRPTWPPPFTTASASIRHATHRPPGPALGALRGHADPRRAAVRRG